MTGSTFTGNYTHTSDSYGGGIYSDDDNMVVNGATFTSNSAGEGGGFYNQDDATLTGATFSKNQARWGAGLYNFDTTVALSHSRISANTATIGGGGIYNDIGTVTLTTTSVTGNHPDNCEPLNTITGCTS